MTPSRPRPQPMPNNTAGVVERGKVYVADVLYRELRWKAHSKRQAKRLGMPVVRFGSRDYIIGDRFIDWFEQIGKQQAEDSAEPETRPSGRHPDRERRREGG